jgi:stage II sporulation protein D
MRPRPILLALALLVAPVGGASGQAPGPPAQVTVTTFAISGRGYGHGVGMGQWGAFGLAQRGAGYEEILAHYYPGTALGRRPGVTLRVLLWEGQGRYTILSPVPFRLRDGAGEEYPLAAGRYRVGPRLVLSLSAHERPLALPGPLTFLPGKEPLQVGAPGQPLRPYRGRLQLQPVAGRLQAVNVVALEDYLKGVVPAEMPADWPLQALKAQAVAARSYALAERQDGALLYADQRSQVYGGLSAETPRAVQAVRETRGEVLLYKDEVATTLFFSSSGGRTAALTDVFPTRRPVPYLVSVRDPYDVVSPYHTWGPVLLSAAQVSRALRVAGVRDLETVPATGRARQVVAHGKSGDVVLPASDVRSALGLRSTWIRPAVLSLSRPAEAVVPGRAVTLSGVARRVRGPVLLEEQPAGGAWRPGPALDLAPDGSFVVSVQPTVPTRYRLLAADAVTGQPIRSRPLFVPVTGSRRLAAAPPAFEGAAAGGAAFVPNDPLAASQWYLARIRAFDFWPQGLPGDLAPVKVAVIDTGLDFGHPDLGGRVAAARSFVSDSPVDQVGHGTFVAGIIAASTGNGQGIAGIAFPAQLLVAKVVGADGSVDPTVEARAVRWAADQGARVINLSLGGLRDPARPARDTFSAAEQEAIAYATRRGALVVAAVGNSDQAPRAPWPYASYPAALPHVVGVSALAEDGSVPLFSNRDAVFNDLAAPGEAIVSTLPRALTALRPSCVEQGYSPCGPPEYRQAAGTSFAAAQVSAAAALLFAAKPTLRPEQAAAILERTAVDVAPATGCQRCPPGRDALSGWGRLDVAAALQALSGPLPPADRYEPNDDAGERAATLWGRTIQAKASLDFWDDPTDVYRVRLRPGERIRALLQGPVEGETDLVLWKPGTEHVQGPAQLPSLRATQATQPGLRKGLRYRAGQGGWYYVEVSMRAPGAGSYRLRIEKQ